MNFFRRLIRNIKRAAIIFVVLAFLGSIFYTVRLLRKGSNKAKFSAIIDTDSGNGVDNLFAVARALADPGFEVIGITSSQWNYYPKLNESTAGRGRNLNDTLLQLFRRQNVPSYKGGEEMVGYWNHPVPKRSEASDFIIKKAHQISRKSKLNIIVLGSLTNIATAILLDSSIIPKIKVYAHAMLYEPGKKIWNKNECNVRNDLDALDIVLNSEGLELHIMPVSSSKLLVFNKSEISELLKFKGPQWDFILNELVQESPDKREFSMSDVSLMEAALNNEFTKEEYTANPPENMRKTVLVYSWINKEFMKIDYWKVIRKYISDKSNKPY